MTYPLMPCGWNGTAFVPLQRFHNIAAGAFVEGEIYDLEVVEERSPKSHRHYFACIRDSWLNLPESAALEPWAQSSEHLRKFALIKTGWHTCTVYACGTKAEASRTARVIRAEVDEFTIAIPRGSTVEIYRAKSQSVRAMGKADFQKSKDDVLNFLAGLVGGRSEGGAA